MIRKFFAFLLVLIFAFLLMPMVLLQSFMSSFLSESRLSQKIIPATYESVTSMFAGQFSHRPEEAKLFQERIRDVFPRDKYTQLIFLVVRPFLAKELPAEIDMKPLKETLKQDLPQMLKKLPVCDPRERSGETFRFCLPPEFLSRPSRSEAKQQASPTGLLSKYRFASAKQQLMPSRGWATLDKRLESDIADAIQKQIPQKIPLNGIKDPEIQKTLRAFFFVKNYMSLIFIGVALVILGLQALIVFSPWSSILKWLGASVGSLALLLTLFLISLDRLDIVAAISEGFAPSQIQLLKTLIEQPLSLLTLWMFFLWSAAVLLFGSGIIFAFKTHSKK